LKLLLQNPSVLDGIFPTSFPTLSQSGVLAVKGNDNETREVIFQQSLERG
jgi:hypothetical protein